MKTSDYEKLISRLNKKRQEQRNLLQEASDKDLVDQLLTDSREGREPFNSQSYRRIVEKGDSGIGEALAAVMQTTEHKGGEFLLPLLALREVNRQAYSDLPENSRAEILIDALRHAKHFNTWGLPHEYWEDASRAVIHEGRDLETGHLIKGQLKKLFGDTRPAPLFGSEGYKESVRYGYRVCDYAWALFQAIDHPNDTVPMPPDPALRDELISSL